MQKKNFTRITLLITSSLTVMANATIAPSLPQLSRVFESEPNSEFLAKLILTMPSFVIAFSAPFAGYIIDRFGRKKLLLYSILLYGIAGSSGLVLNNLYAILLGRAFLGLAITGIMTTSVTLIADYFADDERVGFMGLQASFMAFGAVVFIGTGGILADYHWRAPFAIYLTGFLAALPVWFYIYEPDVKKNGTMTKINIPVEVYPRLNVIFIYFMGFLGMLLFYMIPVQFPFLMKDIGITGNTETGLVISFTALFASIIAYNYKRIKKHLSFFTIYSIMFLFMGTGYLILYSADSFSMVVIGAVISGLGSGLLMPNTNLWLVNIIPEGIRGRIIGGLTSSIFLGQFMSPVIVNPLLDYYSLAGIFGLFGIFMIVSSPGFLIYRKIAQLKNSTK